MDPDSRKKYKINVYRLGLMDYMEALEIQSKLWQLRTEDRIEDTLLILEHLPVITIGRRGKQSNILMPQDFLAAQGIQICQIGRGGDVTYHGPGQIIGYPIMRFKNHVPGVKELILSIEDTFIQLLDHHFQLEASHDSQFPGVWIDKDKITAIGLLIRSEVTMHGFAFNVNTDLVPYQWILSCGLVGRGVTSLQKIMKQKQDIEQVKMWVIQSFCHVFKLEPQLKDKKELESVLTLLP